MYRRQRKTHTLLTAVDKNSRISEELVCPSTVIIFMVIPVSERAYPAAFSTHRVQNKMIRNFTTIDSHATECENKSIAVSSVPLNIAISSIIMNPIAVDRGNSEE